MPPKEKNVVVGLGTLILCTSAILTLVGGFAANHIALIGLILLCFAGGSYVLIRSRHQEPPSARVQQAEQDETV